LPVHDDQVELVGRHEREGRRRPFVEAVAQHGVDARQAVDLAVLLL
jgi:hypothetical protein